jgi:hypothetical protein
MDNFIVFNIYIKIIWVNWNMCKKHLRSGQHSHQCFHFGKVLPIIMGTQILPKKKIRWGKGNPKVIIFRGKNVEITRF